MSLITCENLTLAYDTGVVADETGAEILTLNSLQVVADFENTTYLAVMRSNLENLKKALQ